MTYSGIFATDITFEFVSWTLLWFDIYLTGNKEPTPRHSFCEFF